MGFVGRKPDLSAGKLMVTKDIFSGEPVIFDTTIPGKVTLRLARVGEVSNSERAIYKFEWQKDKSLLFYELYDLDTLRQLDKINAADASTQESKAYEQDVINIFFGNGQALSACIPKDTKSIGFITAYIKVSSSGKDITAYVLPEGGVTKCLIDSGSTAKYRKPPGGEFVAKAAINVTE